MRVALIFGGRSGEHEISVLSATSIHKALLDGGFEPVAVGITKDGHWVYIEDSVSFFNQAKPLVTQDLGHSCYILPDPLRPGIWVNGEAVGPDISQSEISQSDASKPEISQPETSKRETFRAKASSAKRSCVQNISVDVIFPVLHGIYGEDGTIQGLLDLSRMPYVGPGTLASAVCMDKDTAKMLLIQNKVPCVPSVTVERHMWEEHRQQVLDTLSRQTNFPVFVKPSASGSSLGVTKVSGVAGLADALENSFLYDCKALVEPAKEGFLEVECAVLGNEKPRSSVAGQIVPAREFYDYEAKYMDEGTCLVIPAPLSHDLMCKVKQLAVAAFKATGCSGLARVDFFVRPETGEVYVNELNTMPGFTKVSMYPKLWEASGKPYSDLVSDLLDLALERKKATDRYAYLHHRS